MKIALIENKFVLSEGEYINFIKGQSIKYCNFRNGIIKEWELSDSDIANRVLEDYRCEYMHKKDKWIIKEYLLMYYKMIDDKPLIDKIVLADELMYFIKTENTCDVNFLSSELNNAIQHFTNSETKCEPLDNDSVIRFKSEIDTISSFSELIEVLNNYKDIFSDGKEWILDCL